MTTKMTPEQLRRAREKNARLRELAVRRAHDTGCSLDDATAFLLGYTTGVPLPSTSGIAMGVAGAMLHQSSAARSEDSYGGSGGSSSSSSSDSSSSSSSDSSSSSSSGE